MTRDEIRLTVFVLAALVVGATVQWWVRRDPAAPSTQPAARKAGWANPPYVFKSKVQADGVKESLETARVGE